MNKKTVTLFVTTLVLIIFNAMPVMSATVYLNGPGSDFYVGDTFEVEVWADGQDIGEELLAFGFDISFDDSILNYNNYVIESGFDDDSEPSLPNEVAGSRFPDISATTIVDDWLLATLSFTAIGAGDDTLNINGPYDEDFSGLYYESAGFDIAASLDISVTEPNINPIPEPNTILLFGIGLLGFAGVSRRKSNP